MRGLSSPIYPIERRSPAAAGSSRRSCRGGAPSPPGFFGGGRWRFCRGRPMCRPGRGSSRDPFTGGHMGPPLHGGVFGNQRKFARETDLAPTGRDRARPLQGDWEWTDGGAPLGGGGVGSPRPTEAAQVMPSIGADVGIGPYGSNAGGTRQTGRYRAFLGQTRVHSRQRMHSVAFFRRREGSVMSTPMEQTARHRPQWTHFVSSHFTRRREK